MGSASLTRRAGTFGFAFNNDVSQAAGKLHDQEVVLIHGRFNESTGLQIEWGEAIASPTTHDTVVALPNARTVGGYFEGHNPSARYFPTAGEGGW